MILAIAVIVLVARVFGNVARKLGQPPVIGELVAGISLGPSVLGLLPGHLDIHLFPEEVTPYLRMLAQLGLVLFVFIVGLELDVSLIRGRVRGIASISLLSFVVPFALGILVATILHPLHRVADGKTVPSFTFELFMGTAMSVTAFPVLARILADRGVSRTAVGFLALSAAAVDDVIAWILLAFVYAVAKGNDPLTVVRILMLTTLFAAAMFGIGRPLLAQLIKRLDRSGEFSVDMLAVMLVGMLLSAYITQRIGIHEIFGAFFFGAIVPREGTQQIRREILDRIEHVNLLLLLPMFFVVAGFGVDLRAFKHPDLLWQLLLILAMASVGKIGGAFTGARLQRICLRRSAAIAILMNTRGLTELVVLAVGKQAGIFDTDMFTMMVIMALATTVICHPLLRIVYPDKAIQNDIEGEGGARDLDRGA